MSPSRLIPLLLLVMFIAALAHRSTTERIYNWDLIPYAAVAMEPRYENTSELHAALFDTLRRHLPADIFRGLTTGAGGYRQAVATSATALENQLDFYRVKWLYVAASRPPVALGASPIETIYWLSLIPAIASILLLFRWLQRHHTAWLALIATIVITLASRLDDLARAATPDALYALLLLGAFYLLIEKELALPGLVLLIGSVAVRTNGVVPALVLLALLALHRPGWRRAIGAAAAAAIAGYFTIHYAFESRGWWTLFQHTLVAPMADPAAEAIPFSLSLYLEIVAGALHRLVFDGLAPTSVLIPFLIVAGAAYLGQRQASPARGPLIAFAANLVLFALLFPTVEHWDRFFAPFYLYSGVILMLAHGRATATTPPAAT